MNVTEDLGGHMLASIVTRTPKNESRSPMSSHHIVVQTDRELCPIEIIQFEKMPRSAYILESQICHHVDKSFATVSLK